LFGRGREVINVSFWYVMVIFCELQKHFGAVILFIGGRLFFFVPPYFLSLLFFITQSHNSCRCLCCLAFPFLCFLKISDHVGSFFGGKISAGFGLL